MGLTVNKEISSKTTTIKLKGILDISTTHLIDRHLKDLTGIEEIIFDFSGLEFIDSTGIGSIMNAIYLSQEKNILIKFKGIDELTHQVFQTIGLYQILEVANGEVV